MKSLAVINQLLTSSFKNFNARSGIFNSNVLIGANLNNEYHASKILVSS